MRTNNVGSLAVAQQFWQVKAFFEPSTEIHVGSELGGDYHNNAPGVAVFIADQAIIVPKMTKKHPPGSTTAPRSSQLSFPHPLVLRLRHYALSHRGLHPLEF